MLYNSLKNIFDCLIFIPNLQLIKPIIILNNSHMKKILIVFILSPLCFVTAQNFRSLDKSPMDRTSYPAPYRISDKSVVVTYSRPQLKGRSFEEIVPENKIWRTGANEATEIRVFKPILFGGKSLDVGTYSLYTIFGENNVTVIVNTAINSWGSYSYKQENDIARVVIPQTKSDTSLEAFSMAFSENETAATLDIGWGYMRASVPVSVL